MDFKKLEAQFKAFMNTEMKASKSELSKKLAEDDTSIFSNHKNVNKFIGSQYGIDANEMKADLEALFNADIKDGQFVDTGEFDFFDDIELEDESDISAISAEDAKNLSEAETNIGSSMIEVINDVLKDEDMQAAIDKDGDGEITDKEIQSFLESAAGIDGNKKDISMEDILSAVDAVKNLAKTKEAEEKEIESDDDTDVENSVNEQKSQTAPVQSTGGSSGGGYVGGSSGGGGYSPAVSNASNSNETKNIGNMNADELKAELDTKKGELSTKQDELNKATSGETPELQAKQEAIDEAYDKYLEEVKNVDEKLAKELDEKKTDIDNKKQEIADKESEISENECKVSEVETAVSNAESKIGSLESAISSISSSISSGDVSDEKKASLQSKKSELESQLQEAKQEKTDAEKSLEKAKDALKTSKEEKSDLEKELETLEGEMEEIEAKILEANPKIEEYMNEYKEAQEDFDTAKADAISKAQEAVNVAQVEVNEIQNKLTEVQNKAIEASAKLSSLAGSYKYNGADYNCIMDQAELDKLVADAVRGGAGTKFGKEDKCLSIAETYGAWITGDSNTSCDLSGTYQDATKYSVFNTENKEELLATIKEELDAGRPPVLHVNGAGIGRHYVTVVGYKASAGDTLQESDLLIWDSYASTIGSCPDDRHMITGWSTGRTGNDGYGWQVYKRN